MVRRFKCEPCFNAHLVAASSGDLFRGEGKAQPRQGQHRCGGREGGSRIDAPDGKTFTVSPSETVSDGTETCEDGTASTIFSALFKKTFYRLEHLREAVEVRDILALLAESDADHSEGLDKSALRG